MTAPVILVARCDGRSSYGAYAQAVPGGAHNCLRGDVKVLAQFTDSAQIGIGDAL
jgi:hypothetical protein